MLDEILSFRLRLSVINVNKSATVTKEILKGKLNFL